MVAKFFEDFEGNQSSKRLTGFTMVVFAMILSLLIFVLSFCSEIPNQATLLDLVHTFVYSGSSLLGIGVLENFSKTK